MLHVFKMTLLLSLMFVLTACGGGGGGGSSSTPTTPPPTGGGGGTTPTSLNVSRTALSFQARQYQALPDSQDITISASGGDVAQIIVGFAPGVVEPEWLGVELTGNVSASTLTLSIINNDINFGTFSTPLRIVSATASDTVIDTVDLTITYDLEQGKLLRVDRSEITVRSVPGTNPVVETVTLSSSGLRDGEVINWERLIGVVVGEDRVTLNKASGVLASGETETLEVSVEPLISGVDSTTFIPLDFAVDDDARGTSLRIQASSIDGLLSDPSTIDVVFDEGDTTSQTTSIDLLGARFSEPTTATWQAVVDQTWVTLTTTGAAGLDVTVDPSTLDVGSHEAIISVTHDISSQVLEVPVEVIIAGPVMEVSQRGVALSNQSDLSKLITVTDSNGAAISWTAVSSEPWLNVTPNGDAATPLNLTADITGLPDDSLFVADVTVSNSTLSEPAVIQVGLWTGTQIEERLEIDAVPVVNFGFARDKRNMVADPIRPYAYVKTESPDGIRSTDVSTYNIYTGEKVGETVFVDIDPNGDIMVTDDGRYAFIAGDNGTGTDERTVAKIDLVDMSTTIIRLSDRFTFSDVVFARVKSQGVLISSRGVVMDVETEEVVSNLPEDLGSANIRVSRNGQAKCLAFDDGLGGEFNCATLSGAGLSGGPISSVPLTDTNVLGGDFRLGAVFALSNSGENLVFRRSENNSSDELKSVRFADQSETFSFAADVYDIQFDLQDNILVAEDALTVSKFSPDGALVASGTHGSFGTADEMVLSGDGDRVLQLTDDTLFIMPVPEN